jgi:hypothetical protein
MSDHERNIMKVLVACEESQVVTKAFRAKGHEAYSCDIIDCSGGHPEWHIKDDALKHLSGDWDMILAFPPCTYLCSSGMHWTTRGLRDPQLTEDALDFVGAVLNSYCEKIVLENPIGCISTRIRKPDQIIQPWMFGDNASKKTCLWLKDLQPLEATKIIPPKGFKEVVYAIDCTPCDCCGEPYCLKHEEHYADCSCISPTQDDAVYKKIDGFEFATLLDPPPKPVWSNQTPSGQNKLGPSPERAKARSKTFPGIANAMADQWS